MRRCFVGLALPPATHQSLRPLLAALAHLRDLHTQLRPVPERNLHCTLKFLGETSDAQRAALREILAEVAAGTPAFAAQAAGIGLFGAPRPRAIFAGVGVGRAEIVILGERLDAACERTGFARDDRPRVPHVTLARVQSTGAAAAVAAWAAQQPESVYGPLETALLHLYQSETGPTGSVYRVLETFPIAGGP